MSTVDDLIFKFCPNGVQSIALEAVFDLRNGYTPSKSNSNFWKNGTVPWFRMEDIQKNGRILDSAIQSVHVSALKGAGLYEADSIIISTSATIGEHALVTVPFLANQRFTVLTRKQEFKEKLLPKFAYYLMFDLAKFCRENTTVSSFAGVEMSKFRNYRMQIPPLQVQKEIVEVLDKFTDLELELKAELEARKSQFEFYRDQLLRCQGLDASQVRICSLGEIGSIVSGLRSKSKDDFSDGNAPYVSYVEIFNNQGIDFVPEKRVKVADSENQNAIHLGDLLVTGSSETRNECGMTAVVTTEPDVPIYVNSFCFIWRPDKELKLDPQFTKHLFRGRAFRDQVIQTANGVTRQNISKPKFLGIKIPIPPTAFQSEVASILNSFVDLINSLETELEARRVQTSHYMSKLLAFSEMEAA